MHALSPKLFEGRPVVSFLVQYFKRPWVVEKLVAALQVSISSSLLSYLPSSISCFSSLPQHRILEMKRRAGRMRMEDETMRTEKGAQGVGS
jgi:hypothetical protein